ncbi:MAG: SH3 domain-containing protein [Leptolyngbyaceae bacterium]|nr:SH3 domain-containing protein [Leptolyngbyaceae bacterium]
MKLFGILRFVTGVLIALVLLFAGGAVAARYIITRLTAPPAKPIFVEEQVSQPTDSTDSASSTDSADSTSTDTTPASQQTNETPSEAAAASEEEPVQVFTDSVEPEPDVFEVESTEADADARVTQPIGMVLRQGPSQDTTQIGNLYYNDEVIVLGTSADGEWQNIRLPGSGVEGWIKAGNTESLN